MRVQDAESHYARGSCVWTVEIHTKVFKIIFFITTWLRCLKFVYSLVWLLFTRFVQRRLQGSKWLIPLVLGLKRKNKQDNIEKSSSSEPLDSDAWNSVWGIAWWSLTQYVQMVTSRFEMAPAPGDLDLKKKDIPRKYLKYSSSKPPFLGVWILQCSIA